MADEIRKTQDGVLAYASSTAARKTQDGVLTFIVAENPRKTQDGVLVYIAGGSEEVRKTQDGVLAYVVGESIIRKTQDGLLYWTSVDPPVAPVLDSVTAVNAFRIDLAWTLGSNHTKQRIYRDNILIKDNVDPAQTTYVDNTVAPNTNYCYRVAGVNIIDVEAKSNELCATTPAPPISGAVLLVEFLSPDVGSKISGPTVFRWRSIFPGPWSFYISNDVGVTWALLEVDILDVSFDGVYYEAQYTLNTTTFLDGYTYSVKVLDDAGNTSVLHMGFVINNGVNIPHEFFKADPGFQTWNNIVILGATPGHLDANVWGVLWDQSPGWYRYNNVPTRLGIVGHTALVNKNVLSNPKMHAWAIVSIAGVEQAPVWSGGMTDWDRAEVGIAVHAKDNPQYGVVAAIRHNIPYGLGDCLVKGQDGGGTFSLAVFGSFGTSPGINVTLWPTLAGCNRLTKYIIRIESEIVGAEVTTKAMLQGPGVPYSDTWQLQDTSLLIEEGILDCGATGIYVQQPWQGFQVQPIKLAHSFAAAWDSDVCGPPPPPPPPEIPPPSLIPPPTPEVPEICLPYCFNPCPPPPTMVADSEKCIQIGA